MAEHNELGETGEKVALDFLKKKGYKILETNWRFGKDEIDIIVTDKEYLVIVEVKTRTTNYFGEPESFVNKAKQRFLIRAAQAYIIRHDIDLETRFDIISIIISMNQHEIKHLEDAFYPTLGA